MLAGIESLTPYLEHFTHAGVFLLLFLSSFGLPIPEEVTLVAAGLLVHQGVVAPGWLLAAGVAGVLTGDVVVYTLGRRYGEGILRHRILAEWLTPDVLMRIGELERRYGVLALVAARFLPGLKTAAMLAAGLFGTPLRRFLMADVIGGIGSVSAWLGLGYLFADHLEDAVSAVDRLHVFLLGLLVLLLLAVGVHLWARRRLAVGRLAAGEAPEPGPVHSGRRPAAKAPAREANGQLAELRRQAGAAGGPRPPA